MANRGLRNKTQTPFWVVYYDFTQISVFQCKYKPANINLSHLNNVHQQCARSAYCGNILDR